mgnify:CR=1 FL=1
MIWFIVGIEIGLGYYLVLSGDLLVFIDWIKEAITNERH